MCEQVGELESLLAMARVGLCSNDTMLANSVTEGQLASLKEQKLLLENKVWPLLDISLVFR